MKHKVSELEGALLDEAVELAEDADFKIDRKSLVPYSTAWSCGGPIIDREGISVVKIGDEWDAEIGGYERHASFGSWEHAGHGPTALIAAMRAYVASKLGEEVELP